MKAYRCDRCKRYFEKTPYDKHSVIRRAEDYNGAKPTKLDLCPQCQEQFERWLTRTSKAQQQKLRQMEAPELNGGFIFK